MTCGLHIVLTRACTAVCGWVLGAFGHQWVPQVSAGGAVAEALIKGFSDDTKQHQAAASVLGPTGLEALPVVGDHLVLPAGTSGTPLSHTGVVIGAVKPLTASQEFN